MPRPTPPSTSGALLADSNPDTACARRCQARLLRVTGDLVISHASAGLLLDLPYIDPPATPTLTRHRLGAPSHLNGMHAAAVPGHHRVQAFGLPLTSGPRTLLDLLRNAPDELVAQALADGGLRAGIDPVQLEEVLTFCAGWPGIVQARAAVAFGEPRCESPLESWARIWFRNGGLPAPTPQLILRSGTGKPLGRVDFCFEDQRVVVECDGQVKYRPGTAWASPSDTLWAEKLREDRVRAERYEVVRAYAKDGKDGGADLCRRIRAAMARASARS